MFMVLYAQMQKVSLQKAYFWKVCSAFCTQTTATLSSDDFGIFFISWSGSRFINILINHHSDKKKNSLRRLKLHPFEEKERE